MSLSDTYQGSHALTVLARCCLPVRAARGHTQGAAYPGGVPDHLKVKLQFFASFSRPAQPATMHGVHQQGVHDTAAPEPSACVPVLLGAQEIIVLGACRSNETLPQNPDLPADVFTACLTTPIKVPPAAADTARAQGSALRCTSVA